MTIISAIIMLGILIFVHELGHFIFAKLTNVKVLKFSLGFGPRIVGKRIGETEYQLSAVPLGGYVKMLGEEVGEDFSEQEKQRAFQFQSLSKRSIIVLAGPVFNIILTYIIFTIVLSVHLPISIPDIDSLLPEVREVVPGSPAYLAGIREGDRILQINGKEINTQNEIIDLVSKNPGKELNFTVRRGDEILEYQIIPEATEINVGDQKVTVGQIGVENYLSPVIGDVSHDSPAMKSGMKKGDRILKINDRDIGNWLEMVQIVKKNPNKSMRFTILRGEDTLELHIVPEEVEVDNGDDKKTKGQIGVMQANASETITSKTLLEAFYKGGIATYKWGFIIFDSIKVLVKGDISLKNVAGPITIVRESGKAASLGLLPYLMFMAFFSVNLGVLNLLPIPVLDGGHLMFFVLERIKGGPLDERTVHIAHRIGLSLLIALMVLAFYNDIMRIFVWK